VRFGFVIVALWVIAESSARAESCSFSSMTAVAFGSYNVFDPSPVLSAGSLSYTCSSVQASDTVTIELAGLSDAATSRVMVSGSHLLHYQLYLDPARTLIWGNGAGGTVTYGPLHPGDGVPTSVPIYGRVAARQDVPVGSYADTVTVTVLF
jgi:spore coat protein U-like protein